MTTWQRMRAASSPAIRSPDPSRMTLSSELAGHLPVGAPGPAATHAQHRGEDTAKAPRTRSLRLHAGGLHHRVLWLGYFPRYFAKAVFNLASASSSLLLRPSSHARSLASVSVRHPDIDAHFGRCAGADPPTPTRATHPGEQRRLEYFVQRQLGQRLLVFLVWLRCAVHRLRHRNSFGSHGFALAVTTLAAGHAATRNGTWCRRCSVSASSIELSSRR